MENMRASIQKSIKDLTKETSKLRTDFNDIRKRMQILKKEIDKRQQMLKRGIKTAQSTIKNLTKERLKLQDDIHDIIKRLEILERQIKMLERRADNESKQVVKKRARIPLKRIMRQPKGL